MMGSIFSISKMNHLVYLSAIGLLSVLNIYFLLRNSDSTNLEKVKNWQEYKQPSTMFQAEQHSQPGKDAASFLDIKPEDLPEATRRLDTEIREVKNTLNEVRDFWANAWWEAKLDDPPNNTKVIKIVFDEARYDDLTKLVSCENCDDNIIILAGSRKSGKFAVSVGMEMTEEYQADNIANQIAALGEGGAGGDKSMATGGGINGDQLETYFNHWLSEYES